jgi:hypothetical protein
MHYQKKTASEMWMQMNEQVIFEVQNANVQKRAKHRMISRLATTRAT